MQTYRSNFKGLIILCVSLISLEIDAQLGFCQGNSGDPIFVENFGVGLNDIALPAGTTTYTYANGQPPEDGLYTVSSSTNYFDWFVTGDHTPNDTHGRMLIVNSSFTAGEFYRTAINGLCENTTYEFSSWLLNLTPLNGFCGAGAIPVNVRFEIWDSTDSNLLASGSTGSIGGTLSPTWDQYALVFQTLPSQTAIILKMINNSSGGCGNDVAIDDIIFKSCGDGITVEDSSNINTVELCSSQVPFSNTISAIPDNSVFGTHFYQWQLSTDGSNWIDIPGETNASITITGVTTTTFYRAKVAEFATNLNNSDCIALSDVYQINITQAPPPPTIACWESVTFDDTTCSWNITGSQPPAPTGLECWEAAVFNTTSCSWDIIGTQPTPPNLECWESTTFNTTTCQWDITGIQPPAPTGLECWEVANFNNSTCEWAVTGTQPEPPQNLLCWQSAVFSDSLCEWEIVGTEPIELREEFISICENSNTTLVATSNINNPEYQWESGEVSPSITIDSVGTYEVVVTDGCLTEIITFIVTEIESPIIESIETEGSAIVIHLSNSGDFEFSLDGINYQFSNIFSNQLGGLYTIYIRSNDCDVIVTQEHFHFFIQKFMTPNDDGDHDFFLLNIAQFFTKSEVYIFNRYGKLLYSAINANAIWDGTFEGAKVPTSDYWYRIVLEGKEFNGHFTLKR